MHAAGPNWASRRNPAIEPKADRNSQAAAGSGTTVLNVADVTGDANADLIVGAGFLISKITGIVDDLILARTIKPGPELDAYYAAFSLPDLLFTLIAGGALASARRAVRAWQRLLRPVARGRAPRCPGPAGARLPAGRSRPPA